MIELNQVTKVYDGDGDSGVHALNGISLNIDRGEMVAIIGASGSGKSTLLNIIGCLDQKTTGTYLLCGEPIEEKNDVQLAALRNKTFGYVLQDFAIIEDWTVYQNVMLPLQYASEKDKIAYGDVDCLLKRLGVYEKKHVIARKLSGGQRQRVSIARALINNPDIILADEPTGSLDQSTGEAVMQILLDIHQEGKTVIIVTHDMKIANRCERILEIVDGMIV